jgi:hypothetical protein
VCGAALGIDRACRDCIAGLVAGAGDGGAGSGGAGGDGAGGDGACSEALIECVETGGACGRWRSCIDAC